jgi:hypothetical protein
MLTNRIQGLAKRLKRQTRTGREWAQSAPAGRKIELEPWSGLRLSGEIRLGDVTQDIDPDVLINSASTGVSFWDGYIPDPVDPRDEDATNR